MFYILIEETVNAEHNFVYTVYLHLYQWKCNHMYAINHVYI